MQGFLGSQSLPSLLPAALSLLLGLSKSSPLTLHLKQQLDSRGCMAHGAAQAIY